MVTEDGNGAFVWSKRRRRDRGPERTRQWKRKQIRRMSRCLVLSGEIPETPCLICGSTESLKIHHIEPMRPDRFVFLCESCHDRAHRSLYRTIYIPRPLGQFSVRPEAALPRREVPRG